jgi:TRAP transporter TAXI family solute receptor
MKTVLLKVLFHVKKDSGIFLVLWLALSLGMGAASTAVRAEDISVTIGTGGKTGVYYPVGKAIAQIVNQNSQEYGFQVKVEPTGGSVFNVNAIIVGDLEFGIVQSDRQYQAWNGSKDWKERGSQKKLRSICSFYPESVFLLAGDDTGIETLSDLKGKHVNIGNIGAGARGNAIDAMQACGLDWRRELNAESFRWDDAVKMLRDGQIDAFFHTIGHPHDSIKEATTGPRKVHFVPLTGDCIVQLAAKWPYYAISHIPKDFYPMARNTEDIETFGVKATFCTSADVPEEIVYTMTREIFTHLEDLKALHPALGLLTQDAMLEALSAPIHPGAMKYYKEVGLIK